MLAKVFEGKPRIVEDALNDWLGDVRPVVKTLTSAAFKSGVIYITVLYENPRKTPDRVRGSEAAGEAPPCPTCGKAMARRERRADGVSFWGCTSFPTCRGTVNFDEADEEAERRRTMPDEPEFGGQGGYYDSSDDIPF